MARLLGEQAWLLEDDRFGVVYQDARPGDQSGYSRIGWHSDHQSGPHLDMWPSVGFTIHIDPTSPRNGFLRVLPGSHLGGTDEMPLGFEHVPGEIAVYCERGDVLLHHSDLWHSAARATDDGEGAIRRHVRGGWYGGARLAPEPRPRRLRQERPPLTSAPGAATMLAMAERIPRDLRTLPKGHLHLHLEGSMRPSTLAELADAAGIPVPEIRGYGSFSAFADTYVAACQVLETPEHFARLVLRSGRGQRDRRRGVGGAVVLRAPPPRPLRRRRGDRRHGPRRAARRGRAARRRGRADARRRPHGGAVGGGRSGATGGRPRRPRRRVVRPRQRRSDRAARALRRAAFAIAKDAGLLSSPACR